MHEVVIAVMPERLRHHSCKNARDNAHVFLLILLPMLSKYMEDILIATTLIFHLPAAVNKYWRLSQ